MQSYKACIFKFSDLIGVEMGEEESFHSFCSLPINFYMFYVFLVLWVWGKSIVSHPESRT